MISVNITKEMLMVLSYSIIFNLMIQIIYHRLHVGKFHTTSGIYANTKLRLHYLMIIFDALMVPVIFWYGQNYMQVSLEDILMWAGIFSILETVFREIKDKKFYFNRIVIDSIFNVISLLGTYFIFSKLI